MKEVKFCKDCKYSNLELNSSYALRCIHPSVNSDDEWALSQVTLDGTSCRVERDKGFLASYNTCGKSGKLFEKKETV